MILIKLASFRKLFSGGFSENSYNSIVIICEKKNIIKLEFKQAYVFFRPLKSKLLIQLNLNYTLLRK